MSVRRGIVVVPNSEKSLSDDYHINYDLPPGLSDFETARYIKTPLNNGRLNDHLQMARARFTDADRDRKEKRLQDRVVQRYKPELDLLRAHQAASKRTTPRFRGPNKEGNIERHSKNRGAPLLHAQQTVRARRSLTAHAANREVRAAKKPVKSNALNKLRISLKR